MTSSACSASSRTEKDDTVLIPDEFICPITQELMVDPVMSRYGQSYERHAIVDWLSSGTNACPLTRQPLKLPNLVTHHNLRTRIESWCQTNGLVISDKMKAASNGYCTDNHPAVTAAFFNLPNRLEAEEGNTDRTSEDEDDLTPIRVVRLRADGTARFAWLNGGVEVQQQRDVRQRRPSLWTRLIRRR